MTLLATITEHARVAPTGAMVVDHARDLWVEHKDRWRDLADANTDAAR